MCKLNKKNQGRRIDPCMKTLIENLNIFRNPQIGILSCCCGHGKYRMSIVIDAKHGIYDLISGKKR